MTDVNAGRQYGVGARRAILFALNASGSPAATDTSPYSGVQIVGIKGFEPTQPDARKITHTGDDSPLQVDFLPPTEAMSGSMDVAEEDQAVLEILTGNKSVTLGEAKVQGLSTSNQGFESQVGLLIFQQSLSSAGARNWRWFLFPKAIVYPHEGGFNDNPAVHKFQVAPAVVSSHLWETAFAAATEGFTRAQGIIGHSHYMPSVVSWLASTSTVTFALPALEPAATITKMVVWVEGVMSTSWTCATTQIVTGTAPGNNKRVICFYEHSA
jgi:hypothetical protein